MINNHLKCIAILAGSLFWVSFTQAQQATTATGGDAMSSGGSVAYSVGQIDFTTVIGTSGSAAQGVQQPYEFYVVADIESTSIHIELSAFPNPTTDLLRLQVEAENRQDLSFQLVDITGKIIESRKIISSSETIDMENLPGAGYFLKVTCKDLEIKTFKIIKN